MVLMELLTFVMVSFCSPSGLSEALLPISGCDFRRETVCVARCQAVMVKHVRLKHTQSHMRIWLYHGWCSWLFNLSESLLDSRKTEILSGFSGCITPQLQELCTLCTDQLRNLAWRGTPMWRPGWGHLCHENEFNCWRLMTIMLSVWLFTVVCWRVGSEHHHPAEHLQTFD